MKMANKIIIDELEYHLENFTGCLIINSLKTLIHCSGNNYITKLEVKPQSEITFDLENQTSFLLKDCWENNPILTKILVLSHEKTLLEWNLSILTNHCDLDLQNHLIGNKNRSKIKIHAVSEKDSHCKIKSTGWIFKDTKENEFMEELKGLTMNENNILFIPELIVDSESVTATHNATMKCVSDSELFYLSSKGIPKLQAYELIKKGFLESILEK